MILLALLVLGFLVWGLIVKILKAIEEIKDLLGKG